MVKNPVTGKVVDIHGNEAENIGYIFSRIGSGNNIPYIKVQTALSNAGFDPSEARAISKKNAMKRVMADLRKENIIHEVKEAEKKNHDILLFQFDEKIIESLGQEMQLRFKKITHLKYDMMNEVIECDDDKIRQFALDKLAEKMENYLPRNIHELVKRIFEKQAESLLIRLHKDGGIYYVSERNMGLMRKIISFVTEADPEGQVLLIPMVATGNNISTAVSATKFEYSDEISNFKEKLESFKENQDGMSTTVKDNMLADLGMLARQLEIAGIDLNAKFDDIMAMISDFEKEVIAYQTANPAERKGREKKETEDQKQLKTAMDIIASLPEDQRKLIEENMKK